MPLPRLRPTSGFRIACNVVAGCSFGGLALIAEERRRRIAFAQKIIDNGRKLQGYKSYQTAAPLVAFDLGVEDDSLSSIRRLYDEEYPDQQHNDETYEYDRAQMSNWEWKTRRRKHRVIPATSQGRDVHLREPDPSASTISSASTALRNESRINPSSSNHIAFSPLSSYPRPQLSTTTRPYAAKTATAVLEPQSPPIDELQEENLDQSQPQTSGDGDGRSPEFIRHVQIAVARRVNECLGSTSVDGRSKARQELIAYFATHYDTPGEELQILIDRFDRKGSLWSDIKSKRKLLSDPKPIRSRNSSQSFSVDATALAQTLSELVNAARWNEAYQALFQESKSIVDLINRELQAAIDSLVAAYKNVGSLAIVKDIILICMNNMQGYQLSKNDLHWILDRETPELIDDVAVTISNVPSRGEDMQSSIAVKEATCLWYEQQESIEHFVDIFKRLFKADDLKSSQGSLYARHAFESVIQKDDLQSTGQMLKWANEEGFNVLSLEHSASDLFKQIKRSASESQLLRNIRQHAQKRVVPKVLVSAIKAATRLDLRETSSLLMDMQLKSSEATDIVAVSEVLLSNPQGALSWLDKHHYNIEKFFASLYDENEDISAKVFLSMARRTPPQDLVRVIEATEGLAFASIDGEKLRMAHHRILDRVRHWSSSLESVISCFNLICKTKSSEHHHFRPYGVVIAACVHAGRFEEAQKYLHEMKASGFDTTDSRMVGHGLLALAMQKDWNSVEELLGMAGHSKTLVKGKPKHGSSYNAMFKLYSSEHSAQESFDFLRRLHEKFGLTPPPRVCLHLMESIAATEDTQLLAKWKDYARRHHFDIMVPARSTVTLTRRLRKSTKAFAIGTDDRTRFRNEAYHGESKWALRAFRSLTRNSQTALNNTYHPSNTSIHSTTGSHSRRLQDDMKLHLAQRDPQRAIEAFHAARPDGIPICIAELIHLVQAHLRLTPDSPSRAEEHIALAAARGFDTQPARDLLARHVLLTADPREHDALQHLEAYYSRAAAEFRPIRAHAALAFASRFAGQREHASALAILDAFASSPWAAACRFDAAWYTLLLQTHAALLHHAEIPQVMRAVKDDPRVRLDKMFLQRLGVSIRALRRLRQSSSGDTDDLERTIEALEHAREETVRLRVRDREKTLGFMRAVVKELEEDH